VRKANKAATKTQKYVTERLHSKDVDVLQEAFDAVSPVKRGTEFQLEADDTVDRGSCIIETDAGRVDKRFTVQFDILKRAFDQLPKLNQADLTPLAQDGEEA
jgi:flagellar assembly protein FliH